MSQSLSITLPIIAQNDNIALINIKNEIHFWDKKKLNGQYTQTPHNDENKVLVAPNSDYWVVYNKWDRYSSWENNKTFKFYKGSTMILHIHNDNIFDYFKNSQHLGDIIGFHVLDDKYLVLIVKCYDKGLHLYSIEIDSTATGQNQRPKNELITQVLRHSHYDNIYKSNQDILHCSNGHELFIINSEKIYKYWFSDGIDEIQLKTTPFNNRKFSFLDQKVNLSTNVINGEIYLYRSAIRDPRFEIVDNLLSVFEYNVLIGIINPDSCLLANDFKKPIAGSHCLYLSKNLVLEKNIKTGTQYFTIVDCSGDGIVNAKVLQRLNVHTFEPNFEPRCLYQKSFYEDDRYIVMMLNRTEFSKMLILQVDKQSRIMTYHNYKLTNSQNNSSYYLHNSYLYVGNGMIINVGNEYVPKTTSFPSYEIIIKIEDVFNINKFDVKKQIPLPPCFCDTIADFLQIKTVQF